jgi:hypothetical protein
VSSAEDAKAIRDFVAYFGFPMTENLDKALAAFELSQTLVNQTAMKFELCVFFASLDPEKFPDIKEDLFQRIIHDLGESGYEVEFDRQLESELTVPPKEE